MQFGHRNEAREKTITDEQLKRFIDAIKFVEEEDYIFFWENVYYCASYLGLRSIETCRVRIEDIDFIDKTLTLPDQKNKVRYEKIVIPTEMLERFKQHIIKYKAQIIANGSGNYRADKNADLKGEYYIFWRMRNSKGARKEKHLSPKTIRSHLKKTRIKAGLDMKYGMTKDGHALSILSYHTLRHYYMQKICDQRGVFAAQISGRHKNLRSTERYLTTSLKAKRDIVNEVFNIQEQKESRELEMLKNEISELKNILKQSIVLSNGHPENIKNRRIVIEETEMMLQNRALYESRQLRKTKPAENNQRQYVSSLEL
jgi:integrase